MLIDARLIDDEYSKPRWAVDIPMLDSVTQGYTKKEAVAMAIDLVECLLDAYFGDGAAKQAKVSASKLKKDTFYIEAENENMLISLILIRQREKHGVTFKELTERLKGKSTFAYKRYESGKVNISVTQFYKLMRAVAPEKDVAISLV